MKILTIMSAIVEPIIMKGIRMAGKVFIVNNMVLEKKDSMNDMVLEKGFEVLVLQTDKGKKWILRLQSR